MEENNINYNFFSFEFCGGSISRSTSETPNSATTLIAFYSAPLQSIKNIINEYMNTNNIHKYFLTKSFFISFLEKTIKDSFPSC